ncbi:hypothetical protein I7I51_05986 [Histoplasma capsulatum]|uniref:Uncharacterized protein n=1 Tax=Ajellomyces capsulatus TaxID=5037 RepID=A0A8A1MKH8_AJECA|nr:hypothetical protein I7I51_05986 [Histoplasma capsulatum]
MSWPFSQSMVTGRWSSTTGSTYRADPRSLSSEFPAIAISGHTAPRYFVSNLRRDQSRPNAGCRPPAAHLSQLNCHFGNWRSLQLGGWRKDSISADFASGLTAVAGSWISVSFQVDCADVICMVYRLKSWYLNQPSAPPLLRKSMHRTGLLRNGVDQSSKRYSLPLVSAPQRTENHIVQKIL